MTLRALVVDDEPLARQQLRRLLGALPGVEVAGECESGDGAVRAIEAMRPDLVFLDVQMPGRDGFGVIAAVGAARMPAVVFVTAYDQYAVAALRAHAADYLLKPVEPAELAGAVERARAQLRSRSDASLHDSTHAHLEQLIAEWAPRHLRRLVAKSAGRMLVVDTADVDWIEARDDRAAAHAGPATHAVSATLTALAAQLDPARFARIHRSTIVNMDRVREVQPWFRGEYVAILKDGTRLTIGPTYRDPFLQRLRGL